MKHHSIKSLGIIIFLIFSFSTYAQETKWVFVKEKEGIKVFYRKSAFKELNEVMIQTTFNTKLSIIVAAFNDFDAYPNWVYKSVKSYLIKTINQNEIEYYNKFDFPFPLDDREIVIHNKIEQNPQIVFVEIGDLRDPVLIAKKEIWARKCPLKIIRKLNETNQEHWSPNEMILPVDYSN